MNITKRKIGGLFQLANRVGFLHLLSANLLIQISAFGGQIFLTRILSVNDIGTIKVLQSYLTIFVLVGSLGLNTSVLKLCSEEISENEQKGIFNISFLFTIISSMILILAVDLLVNSSIIKVNSLLKDYVYLIPIFNLTNLIFVYLQSQQKIKIMSIIQSYSKIFIVILSTLVAFWFGFKGYIYSLIFLNLVSFLGILVFIRNEVNFKYIYNITKSKLKSIFNIGLFAFGSNLLGQLMLNVNIIMATFLTNNSKEIGYYGIAQLIISAMIIIPSTLGQIMIPKISKLSNNVDEVKKTLRDYRVRNTLLCLLISLIAGATAPFIIPLVFGRNYSNSVLYFEILLMGFIFWSLYSPIGNTLLSVGRSDINFYMNVISVFLNFILNYLLIRSYGMFGAAAANTITYLITIFIYNFFFKKLYINVAQKNIEHKAS
ncbi:oligosaccharide flippase family protein [Paenibacillus sp. BSR1-1]|uniref:oligosaccharide flippase family protein n=1 Tax=Paenibacillus sp. BSR1-1 TaxID=3020845 RepID=UPI0025B1B22A|nr:oligosaccharide flippase family protein [Paenibacillus sp. BSR1-1]MDN3019180.1 oligosaccharide flippase family protein [Paenibacillus sp. BSR1-1]